MYTCTYIRTYLHAFAFAFALGSGVHKGRAMFCCPWRLSFILLPIFTLLSSIFASASAFAFPTPFAFFRLIPHSSSHLISCYAPTPRPQKLPSTLHASLIDIYIHIRIILYTMHIPTTDCDWWS
ncbi:hypothetical protein C8F04DRAFT_1085261 [Mycena alexandri]|uniref:Uncharacterized protein n=1 Tax=Mycena alexandri TaxID=1745969 RepID=A0AAD6T9N6_9AGAR|nr:hypothetical protein C8F04DRAFT_1085261 [Mycena alexandri]